MRTVGRYMFKIGGKPDPFKALRFAVRLEGWNPVDTTIEPGIELRHYRTDQTPLDLMLIQYEAQPNTFKILFLQSWFRCAFAGGWGIVGQFPNEIVERVLDRLEADEWLVAAWSG